MVLSTIVNANGFLSPIGPNFGTAAEGAYLVAQATADQLYLASAMTASDTLGSQLQTARGALRSALHGFSESVRAAEHGARFAYHLASVNYARDVDTTIEEATFAFETASIGASTARNIQRNTLFGTAMRGLTTAEGDTLRSRSTARRTHATLLAEAYTTAAQDGAFFEIANHPGDVSALAQLQSQFMMGNAVPIDEALLNDLDPDDPTNLTVAPPTVSPGEAQATFGTAVTAADTALNTAHHSAEDARITAVTSVRDTLGLGMATSDAGWDSTMTTAGVAFGAAIDGIQEFDWQHVRDFVGTVANARKAAELGALTAQVSYLNIYYSSLGSFQTGMAEASVTRATTQAQATADYFVNTAVQEANAAEALAASTGSASDQSLAIAARARADAFAAFAVTYVGHLTTAAQTAATSSTMAVAAQQASQQATMASALAGDATEINAFYSQQIADAESPPPADDDANDDGVPDAPAVSATESMATQLAGIRTNSSTQRTSVREAFATQISRRATGTTNTLPTGDGSGGTNTPGTSNPDLVVAYGLPTTPPATGTPNPLATPEAEAVKAAISGELITAHDADEIQERVVQLRGRNCIEGCHGNSGDFGSTVDFTKGLEELLTGKRPPATVPDAAANEAAELAKKNAESGVQEQENFKGSLEEMWRSRLLAKVGITSEELDGYVNFSPRNQQVMKKIYGYYEQLFLNNPELLWAGMAKLAGNAVWDGLTQIMNAEAVPAINNMLPVPIFIGPAMISLALGLKTERELVAMNKEIFMDLAWIHEAYATGGFEEIARLHDAKEINDYMYNAFRLIDEGRRENNQDKINQGNAELLRREQRGVLRRGYKELSRLGMGKAMAILATSPIPGGRPFNEIVPSGDLADFDDRWKWITEDMLPRWLKMTPEERVEAAKKPLGFQF